MAFYTAAISEKLCDILKYNWVWFYNCLHVDVGMVFVSNKTLKIYAIVCFLIR